MVCLKFLNEKNWISTSLRKKDYYCMIECSTRSAQLQNLNLDLFDYMSIYIEAFVLDS